MEVSGHIKIGSRTKGMPSQATKIALTATSKMGNENFSTFPGSDCNGYDSLQVKLPFLKEIDRNFKVTNLSFIKVNGIYKYRAEVVGANVILYPYQPNFEDIQTDLPVIKLGTSKKWSKNLDMKIRAIGYFYIGNDLFDFKTSSAFSIQEIQRGLSLLKDLPLSVIAQTEFELLYKTKLFKTNKTDEVSYLTMKEPQVNLFVSELSDSVIKSLSIIESNRIKDMDKKPITMKEAEEFFGKKIVVELDVEENNEFSYSSHVSASDLVEKVENIESKKEAKREELKEKEAIIESSESDIDLLVSKGIPLALAKGLVVKLGDQAISKATELEFFIPNIIKLIANG